MTASHRMLATLAALALGAGATAACSGGGGGDAAAACPASEIPDHDENTLIVEGDTWSGYAPFRDPELLAGTPYELVWVEQFCQDVRAADLNAGRTDIVVTTLDQYLLNAPEGTVVGVINQSIGADALLLGTRNHPGFDNVDDIPDMVRQFAEDGRRPVLAYTGLSPSEMLLNELANTTDELRLSDFELVSTDQSATAYQMLDDDEAQLAILWEPDTSAARNAGHTLVLSSADVPDSIVDVIVVGDRLIERDPAAVQALVTSYYTAMDGYLADDEALQAFYAEDGGLDAADTAALIEGIRLYGSEDADEFMNQPLFPLDTPQIEQSRDSIGAVLALIHPDIPLDLADIDGSFVSALVDPEASQATDR
jgi:OmpA-OmpF porin, OOP family